MDLTERPAFLNFFVAPNCTASHQTQTSLVAHMIRLWNIMKVAILLCALYTCDINASELEMMDMKAEESPTQSITMLDTVSESHDVENITMLDTVSESHDVEKGAQGASLSQDTETNGVLNDDENALENDDASHVSVMDIPESVLVALQRTADVFQKIPQLSTEERGEDRDDTTRIQNIEDIYRAISLYLLILAVVIVCMFFVRKVIEVSL